MDWYFWTGLCGLVLVFLGIAFRDLIRELWSWRRLDKAARMVADNATGRPIMGEQEGRTIVKIPSRLWTQLPNQWELTQAIRKRLIEGGIQPDKPYTSWYDQRERVHYFEQTEEQRNK